MSTPWAKLSAPQPIDLRDIMSEELAKDLQKKEDEKCKNRENMSNDQWFLDETWTENSTTDWTSDVLNVSQSDEMIARMLQKEYDKEYNEILKRTEDKFNGSSKVSVSFSNYRRVSNNAGTLKTYQTVAIEYQFLMIMSYFATMMLLFLYFDVLNKML